MNGHDTFRQAVDRLSEVDASRSPRRPGSTLDEIDLFVYHQANSRILSAVGERLGLEPERVVDCIGRYGNTSAATIPLALADAARRGPPGPRRQGAARGLRRRAHLGRRDLIEWGRLTDGDRGRRGVPRAAR